MGKIDYSQAVSFSYSSGSSAVDEGEDEDLIKERKRREESVRRAKIIEERKRAAQGRGRGRGRGQGGGQRRPPPSAAAQQRRQANRPEPLENIDEGSESRLASAATSKAPSARGRGRGRGRPANNAGPSRVQSRQSLRPVTSQSLRPETSQSKRPITAQSNHAEPKEKPPPEEPKVKEEEPKEEEPKKEEQKEEPQEQPAPEPQPVKKKTFGAAVRANIFMRSFFGKKKQEEPEPEPEPEKKEEENEEEEKPEEDKEGEEEAAKQEDEEEKKDEEQEAPPPPPPPPKSPSPEPKEPEADTEPKKEEEEEKTPTPVPEPEPKPESPAIVEEEGAERKSLVSIKEEVKEEEKIKTPEPPPQDDEMTEADKEKARGILGSLFGKRKTTLAPAVRASRTSLQSIGSESQEEKAKKGFLKGLFGRKKSDDDDESMRASRVSLNRSRVSLQPSSETGNSPRNEPVVTVKPPTPQPPVVKSPTPTPPPPPPEPKPETSTTSNRPVVIINTSANDGSFQRTLIEALRGNVSTTDEPEHKQPKEIQPEQPQSPQQPQGVPPNIAYTGLSPQVVPYPMFQPPQPFYGQPNPYMYPPQMMPGYGGYPGGYPGAFPQFNMSMPPVNNPMFPQPQNMVYQQQQPQPVQQAVPIQQQQPLAQQRANQISYTQPTTGANSYTPRGHQVQQTVNNNQPLHIVEKLDAALEAERRRPKVPEDEFEDSDSDDNFYSAEQRRIKRKKRRAKEEKRTERERRRRDEDEREREREVERKSKPRTPSPPPPDIDLTGLLSLIETGQEPPEPGREEPAEDGQESRPDTSNTNGKVPLTEEDELSQLLAQLGAAPSSGTPVPKSAKKRRKSSAPKVEHRENTLSTMLREEDQKLDQLKYNSNRRKSTTDFRTKSRGEQEKRSSVPNLGLYPMGQPGVQSPGQFSGINPEQPRTMSAERLLHEAQKKLMSVQQSLQT
ncbi:uncharacterized protein [Asterias amurensis]|uniref:uncharacterized protein n=1 Tax=Asterias amurensis TaxID=7602 RepID=UPI003AB15635